jgi:hypothetical protein
MPLRGSTNVLFFILGIFVLRIFLAAPMFWLAALFVALAVPAICIALLYLFQIPLQ